MTDRPHHPLPPDAPHALRSEVHGGWSVPVAVLGLIVLAAFFILLF